MAAIDEVFDAVVDLAQIDGLYANIVVGSLPADNGVSMAIGAGHPTATDLVKGMAYELDIVLNTKHRNQRTAFAALCQIHDKLTKATDYPNEPAFQITNISTTAAPNYIDREDTGQWLYGSTLRVNFYYR